MPTEEGCPPGIDILEDDEEAAADHRDDAAASAAVPSVVVLEGKKGDQSEIHGKPVVKGSRFRLNLDKV